MVTEEDSEPGYKLHKFRLLEPVPYADFSFVIGDAVSNIRAALDHAVFCCAILNGNPDPKFRTCSFPFGNDPASFDNGVNGCTSVPEQIRACLRNFQAYKGGNTTLWAINYLCNRDKHALITPVLIGFEDSRFISAGRVRPPRDPSWNTTEDQIEFELFRTDEHAQYEYNFWLDIAFRSPEIQAGKRVIPTLNAFVDEVERVLVGLEAECRILFPDAF